MRFFVRRLIMVLSLIAVVSGAGALGLLYALTHWVAGGWTVLIGMVGYASILGLSMGIVLLFRNWLKVAVRQDHQLLVDLKGV